MQVKAMLGQELCEKATNGAKKFEVTVADDALYDLFGQALSKSLRYGATLELVKVTSVCAWATSSLSCTLKQCQLQNQTPRIAWCQHPSPSEMLSGSSGVL